MKQTGLLSIFALLLVTANILLLSTYLETTEAWSSRKGDVANIGRWLRRDWLVDDQGSILQVGPFGLLHLPKILKGFNYVNCNEEKNVDEIINMGVDK